MDPREHSILEEQRIYARWLAAGILIGFSSLVASFFIYLFGLMPPGIPPETLPRYWSLPVHEYVALTGAPTGWSWLRRLGESDLLNFAGVAVLGTTTLVCYLRLVPVLAKARDRILLFICLAEIVVLAVAASGVAFSTH